MKQAIKIDPIDLISAPLFVATMVGEAALLRRVVVKRDITDLDNAAQATLSGAGLPGDALVPVGYERRDTTASLLMLAGNVALMFGTASILARLD